MWICCTENEDLATIACVNSVNTANQHASYVTAMLEIDPYSAHGIEWLKSSREIIFNLQHNNNEERNGYEYTANIRSKYSTES